MIKYIDKHKCRLIISVGSGKDRKRVYKTVTYKGKRDAEKQHEDFRRQVLQGGVPDSISVESLLNWYIDSIEAMGARETTIYGYKSTAKRIKKACGKVKASELTSYRLEKEIVLKRKYSPKTIKNTISLLSSAYKKAISVGMLNSNPCEKVQIPKQKKPEITILMPDEIKAFIEALENESHDFKVACLLALLCGLRRSEVLGITESSVSDVSNIIMITQGRHRIGTDEAVTETKTEKSRRAVAIPSSLMAMIRELIKEHHSSPYVCSEFLIQDEFGEPMKPNYLTQHIAIFEENNNLQRVSFHGLRHTHASMLNASGVDVARISAQLGHSTIGTTMNIYTHVFGSPLQSTQDIAEAMEQEITKIGQKMGTFGKTKTAETQ